MSRSPSPVEKSTSGQALSYILCTLDSAWHRLCKLSRRWLWKVQFADSIDALSDASTHLRNAEEGLIASPAPSEQFPPALITSTMQLGQVTSHLVQHGCTDITSELELDCCTQYPLVQGGFGRIHQGMLHDGTKVAIKCIEVLGYWGAWEPTQKSLKHTAHELYAWSKCDHPGILKVLGFAQFGGHILLVSPWMEASSLCHYIARHPGCNRLQLCIELAAALEYLHAKGIVHGDIKADNVVMSDDGHVQLADFGSAMLANYSTLRFTHTTHTKGTLRFTAPELLDGSIDVFTVEADVYALGMTILQVMTGELPYANKKDCAILFEVMIRKGLPPRPDLRILLGTQGAEDKLWSLLMRCWVHAPENRPTAIEVKEALVEIECEPLCHS